MTWLSVLVLLTSVLSWTPALAQTATTAVETTPTATTAVEPTSTTGPTSTVAPSSTTLPATDVPSATTPPSSSATVPGITPSATVSPTATTVSNATVATVFGTGGAGLRCRASAPSGTVIVVLNDGEKVAVRGATVDRWVPVTCATKPGWVSLDYVRLSTGPAPTVAPPVSPTASATTVPGTAQYAFVTGTNGENLRCRTAPVTGATITLMPAGLRVELRGAAQSGWYPVKCGGQDGWASAAFLALDNTNTSPTVTPTTTPGTTPAPGTGTGKYVTVSGTGGSGLRCRDAAPSGTVITILADGTRVQLTGALANGWLPVLCAGRAGWISAAYTIGDIPAGTGELWFDVNLSTQYMRVFSGNSVIMQMYVSTGKPGFNTPTGTFYINRKLPTRTMTGVLGGEYYYVPNVPWVMYFTNVGHAIHGAYWHNSFGTPRSHGCINLPVPLAAQLYSITPIGTRMRIHY